MPIAFQQLVENLSSGRGCRQTSPVEEKFSKIKREWEKFVAGRKDIDADIIPDEVFKAWQRCRAMELNPHHQEIPKLKILQGKDLEKLIEDNQDLIGISRPFLNNLYEFVKDSGFSIVLFNASGFILDARHDHQYIKTHQFSRWLPGVQWDEKIAGNNIVSFILKSRKPGQLFGPHHYMQMYQYVTASGAPVINPDGSLIGGIAISSHFYASNDHTLGMAVAAAHAIQNEFRSQKVMARCQEAYLQTDMALSLQKAVLTAIPDALIAVNDRGQILVMNEPARKKFSLEQEDIEGKFIADIYPGKENAPFLQMLRNQSSLNDAEVRIASRTNTLDCLLTCKPIISSSGKPLGKILIFSEIKRITSLVNRMTGASANFRFEDICGTNARFLGAMDQARSVSRSDSNVLLLGESGTGKDLFAQAIHNASNRRNGPYVAINCGAIPRELVASELFGHVEGSFTGSRRGGNSGKFKLADGGTIFLDEIGEMPLELQTTLLRVIEDRCFLPIGGARMQTVNVRIIAATNKDLSEEVRKGNFRKDLYYRINVFTIHLPALAERRDDIPLLVDRFVKKYGNTLAKRITGIAPKLMDSLVDYVWPGNVRELQNVIERMMNIAHGHQLTVDLLPDEILHHRRATESRKEIESPEDFERHFLSRMIDMKLSKSEMARKMNITRATLYRKLSRHNMT